MKATLLMILVAVLALTGCHKEIRLEVKNVQTIDKDSLWSITIDRPVFSSTEEWAENSCVKFNDQITAFLSPLQDSLIAQARQFSEDMQAIGRTMVAPFELIIQDTVFLADENYISVRLLVYTYTGGAHGITGFYSFNYDFKNQKFLTNQEVINYNNAKEINPLLKSNLQNPENCFNEIPTADNLSALNFTRHTLEVTYAQYILGPYSCGYTTIAVPRTKLKGMLLIK